MTTLEQTFNRVVEDLLVPGRVSILGVTGQAGSGKSCFISPLAMTIAQSAGYPTVHLGLDAFFKLSSHDRKIWLGEGKQLGTEEAARRDNQMGWWDFGKARAALMAIKRGESVYLPNVYNREDHGELTGSIQIEVAPKGLLLVIEGVPIAHLEGIDTLVYVHAPAEVRYQRLLQRDPHRQGEEALRRFELTQKFEREYFPRHWDRIFCFVDNSQDGLREDQKVLGSMDYRTALS